MYMRGSVCVCAYARRNLYSRVKTLENLLIHEYLAKFSPNESLAWAALDVKSTRCVDQLITCQFFWAFILNWFLPLSSFIVSRMTFNVYINLSIWNRQGKWESFGYFTARTDVVLRAASEKCLRWYQRYWIPLIFYGVACRFPLGFDIKIKCDEN